MRSFALTTAALALLTLTACGSDLDSASDAGMSNDPDLMMTAAPLPTPSSPTTATGKQVDAVSADVQEYAVAMEQYFFGNGYPRDLAGARAVAKKLTNLTLSPGSTIATYTFDAGAQEFQLCVENPSGASATYDTQPMSTVQTTNTGGCP